MDLRDINNIMEGYKSLMDEYYMGMINTARKEIIELEESGEMVKILSL